MRILLNADHLQTDALKLRAEGFSVQVAEDDQDAAQCARLYEYDLILTGPEALRRLRAARVTTPVIVISDSGDPVAAFTAGADDFMVLPVDPGELIARVRAVVRRSQGHADSIIQVGPIKVNTSAKLVSVDDKPVRLTRKEYEIVELMALRLGQTVTKEQVFGQLYGGPDEPEMKIIDVFICKIRFKLRAMGAGGHIQTVWGRGYRLMPEAGEDKQQKVGVTDSNVGSVLALLAKTPSVSRSRLWLAYELKIEPTSIWSALKNLRDKRWIEVHGRQNTAQWSITSAGIAENARRQHYAAAA